MFFKPFRTNAAHSLAIAHLDLYPISEVTLQESMVGRSGDGRIESSSPKTFEDEDIGVADIDAICFKITIVVGVADTFEKQTSHVKMPSWRWCARTPLTSSAIATASVYVR